MKLLIVDDSMVVRNAVERSARVPDVTEVFQAENGNIALELFRKHNPELVTMDLTMPELDGLECITKIREIDPAACILVISAINSHETAMAVIERGACGFLTKPFTHTELTEALVDLVKHAKEGKTA
jgi:two-component system chemotaxis response regulator CheY